MRIACLALIGCVGFDLVKHAVEISQRHIIVNEGSEVNKKFKVILKFIS